MSRIYINWDWVTFLSHFLENVGIKYFSERGSYNRLFFIMMKLKKKSIATNSCSGLSYQYPVPMWLLAGREKSSLPLWQFWSLCLSSLDILAFLNITRCPTTSSMKWHQCHQCLYPLSGYKTGSIAKSQRDCYSSPDKLEWVYPLGISPWSTLTPSHSRLAKVVSLRSTKETVRKNST